MLPSHHDYSAYYETDDYPDQEVFADARWLWKKWQPGLLFIHPMGIDNDGHTCGCSGQICKDAVRAVDSLLSTYIPFFSDEDTGVLVTSDHGMSEDCCHHDVNESSRLVPFWAILPESDKTALPTRQLDVADLVTQPLHLQDDS